MQKVALIVAGGKGKRMRSDTYKQFLLLKNLPIPWWPSLFFGDFFITLVKSQSVEFTNLPVKCMFALFL